MVASVNTGSHLPKVKDLDVEHPHQREIAGAIADKILLGAWVSNRVGTHY